MRYYLILLAAYGTVASTLIVLLVFQNRTMKSLIQTLVENHDDGQFEIYDFQDYLDTFVGNRLATLQLTIVSDFECPGCQDLENHVVRWIDEMPEELGVHYRFFPTSPLGEHAAKLAIFAGKQGTFPSVKRDLYLQGYTYP